jgi:hypothetical protein
MDIRQVGSACDLRHINTVGWPLKTELPSDPLCNPRLRLVPKSSEISPEAAPEGLQWKEEESNHFPLKLEVTGVKVVPLHSVSSSSPSPWGQLGQRGGGPWRLAATIPLFPAAPPSPASRPCDLQSVSDPADPAPLLSPLVGASSPLPNWPLRQSEKGIPGSNLLSRRSC